LIPKQKIVANSREKTSVNLVASSAPTPLMVSKINLPTSGEDEVVWQL
jgi:hypothetical protein